jgi:hypothetical protein
MSEIGGELPTTPERLEQSFEEARAIAMAAANKSGPLNAFLGTTELVGMSQHLLQHMRNEERWGGTNSSFEPIDFVLAATEVAHDHTTGEASATNVHISERLPAQVTFDIFVDFWLPRVAAVAYGEEYAGEVSAILQKAS